MNERPSYVSHQTAFEQKSFIQHTEQTGKVPETFDPFKSGGNTGICAPLFFFFLTGFALNIDKNQLQTEEAFKAVLFVLLSSKKYSLCATNDQT